MKIDKGFREFLVKTGVFVGLFILFSFIIGAELYQYGLLEDWKIEIYGRVGYILLFSIAGFLLVYREGLLKLNSFKQKFYDYVILVLSFILLATFYLFEKNANMFEINFVNLVLAHGLLVLTMIFLVFGVFGLNFILNFVKSFKKEILYFLGFGIVTASLMKWVWGLWPYFSNVVSKSVYFLLKLISSDVKLIEPRTLIVGGFGAQIAEACSGVYSIFLFTALYLFILFLDWKKLNKTKAILLFVPSVIGAFLVNILRVFLIMVLGAYFSKELAMGLYHSYSGMIFFLVYFALFWVVFYNWMKRPEFRKGKAGKFMKW